MSAARDVRYHLLISLTKLGALIGSAAVRAVRPSWMPDHGLCQHCEEVFGLAAVRPDNLVEAGR